MLGECYIDDSNMKEFKYIHPKQLISKTLPVPVWQVYYSYTTARGNPKVGNKYIIRNENGWDCIENDFNRYIQEQNEKYPERKLSNVKILDISFLGEAVIELE